MVTLKQKITYDTIDLNNHRTDLEAVEIDKGVKGWEVRSKLEPQNSGLWVEAWGQVE